MGRFLLAFGLRTAPFKGQIIYFKLPKGRITSHSVLWPSDTQHSHLSPSVLQINFTLDNLISLCHHWGVKETKRILLLQLFDSIIYIGIFKCVLMHTNKIWKLKFEYLTWKGLEDCLAFFSLFPHNLYTNAEENHFSQHLTASILRNI